jgi:hypothetical protein
MELDELLVRTPAIEKMRKIALAPAVFIQHRCRPRTVCGVFERRQAIRACRADASVTDIAPQYP